MVNVGVCSLIYPLLTLIQIRNSKLSSKQKLRTIAKVDSSFFFFISLFHFFLSSFEQQWKKVTPIFPVHHPHPFDLLHSSKTFPTSKPLNAPLSLSTPNLHQHSTSPLPNPNKPHSSVALRNLQQLLLRNSKHSNSNSLTLLETHRLKKNNRSNP